jgi:serine protease
MSGQWNTSWHHGVLGIPDIWNLGNFGADITIAVLDTGLLAPTGLDRIDFEDLDARGNGIGAVDPTGHGTCCASVIASYLGGALGIAPHAKIVSMRVMETGTSTTDTLDALNYLRNRTDVDIVSCSFVLEGTSSYAATIKDAILALANAGKVIVAAAGDDDGVSSFFPEDMAAAITVAAVDEQKSPVGGSRTGPWIDIAAPGTRIPAITNGYGDVGLFSLSSAAAAVTTGVIALALAASTKRSVAGKKMKRLVRETASPLTANTSEVGRGLIDPKALIAKVKAL